MDHHQRACVLCLRSFLFGRIQNDVLQDQGRSFVGKEIYHKFRKYYIQKEWKRDDEDLPPFIIPELPTIYNYDTNYFNDTYQGIPVGCYNALFDKLLNNTKILYNVDFIKYKDNYTKIADKIIFAGKIDEFYQYVNIYRFSDHL